MYQSWVVQFHERVLVLLLQRLHFFLVQLEIAKNLPRLQLEYVQYLLNQFVFHALVDFVPVVEPRLVKFVEVSLLLLRQEFIIGQMNRNQIIAVLDGLEEVHDFEPVVARLDLGDWRLLLNRIVFTFRNLHQLQARYVQVVHRVVLLQVLDHFVDERDREVFRLGAEGLLQ